VDLGLRDRVALVTAASKGLGRASAEALAAEGARVVVCARGAEALEEAAAGIRAAGGEVTAVPVDVTRPEAPAQLVRTAVDTYGRLDVVVANAGGPPPGRALDLTDEAVEAAVQADLLTSIRLVREAVPHLRQQSWGRVCLITSVTVRQPARDLAASNTARTGLWAWAKTAANDLFDEGITVNLACPGIHDTDRVRQLGHAAGRMGDPADFGKVVAFLCSEPAKFVSGIAMGVDGATVAGLL
jgi:3-oxoacyl-[acyl-carrier protein] reductase